MVLNAAEYPWSSYHYNAQGEENQLITPHVVYKTLGRSDNERQLNYRALFDSHMC